MKRKLDDDALDRAIEMILNSDPMHKVVKELGFKSKAEYTKYAALNPEFYETIERAKIAACTFLEDELLHVADRYNNSVARVKMESIAKILQYRDPKRYGNKIDMNVQVTVDISGAIDRAERRVAEITTTNVIAINGVKEN